MDISDLIIGAILLSNVTIMDAPAEAGTRVFESDEPVSTPATQAPMQQTQETDSAQ